ncbi:monovalent cation/H(+) antiporter subunit G [Rhodoplanes sp. Z2-YC6860]|uniref:monovalent cation/H(+) antiporter subunit G n=1 Tax=Rhodoplanes sp. Z2-YC6860 TaxID=674703 RepID=UPI00078DD089|nr:monovalent cation/H(+) antiporter subunit G [Rhodoplanes sp. Z2-YC6860]AMN44123.1 monovalent cation/H+ antiporter subunit G [Rhodoplanes sp. Z2-YC6860]
MNEGSILFPIAEVLSAVLLVMGAAITLIGSAGLLRLHTFYERVHAPTLGTTLGTACVALASMIYFSALGGRLVLHELLIVIFVTVTTPISLTVLVRAAVFRGTFESKKR